MENKYLYILAWGQLLGINKDRSKRLIELAREEWASPYAVYKNTETGQWVVYDDIKAPHTKAAIDNIVKDLEKNDGVN